MWKNSYAAEHEVTGKTYNYKKIKKCLSSLTLNGPMLLINPLSGVNFPGEFPKKKIQVFLIYIYKKILAIPP